MPCASKAIAYGIPTPFGKTSWRDEACQSGCLVEFGDGLLVGQLEIDLTTDLI
jgi:hypothetical protein